MNKDKLFPLWAMTLPLTLFLAFITGGIFGDPGIGGGIGLLIFVGMSVYVLWVALTEKDDE